ncbi:cob(I)yrinic acid a,c-diamide adenosyltransferase [Candidatus Wirthbacteria bacterium CG2_30_54_11]|uniref:Cob(I)yrinic acid a,c-diamide adenosyltransferase n=1 Tax=Candidatus Wirthbacteria bacterium CG2_30_54_11 TaxID=1817892 RepID=A0A1J5IZ41_9BACT|nr:MAG: cob(I)yrinic acid a,c-diamide adenosyltransferase [Candidatus Wirthbacteria bacterium CG2_30_54_11]
MSSHAGLVHLYTGPSKGKTTAALGLAVRASGHGRRILIIQFMKGRTDYGELRALRFLPSTEIVQFGQPDFVFKDNIQPKDREEAARGLAFVREAMKEGYDLLILDEIVCAVDFGLLEVAAVVDCVRSKPAGLELVMTGRNAPPALIDLADYVTNMQEIKHPYTKGIQAREGVEY